MLLVCIYCYCTVQMLAKQWRKPEEQSALLPNRVFELQPPYIAFHGYYDEVQDHLEKIAGTDEMMSGISIPYLALTIILNVHIHLFRIVE